MEADVKKSRKTDCMRKKFKIYREKLEKERMDTAIGADCRPSTPNLDS